MLKNRQISRICRKKHKPRVKPAKITYLHNAQGQRVFKSEPTFAQALPDETEVGTDFITWLKKNFGWLYASAQTNATLGQSYVYADGQLPEYALLAEYGNGAASGTGRLEYIWLPTDSGAAIPIGVYRGSRFYAIHSDHLNTPRLMTDDSNKAVWQWPYSAFGDNKPTGILKAITNPNNALTQDQTTNALLKATSPAVKFNLRYPGQYADDESNMNYNYYRSYQFGQGRYSQSDPIGLGGGLNRYSYVGGNPIVKVDPLGLLDGFPSRSEHVNRNANNQCPIKKPDSVNQCSKWTQDGGLLGGMNGGKYRAQSGSECAYDANNNLLPDKKANYTYNYGPNPLTLQHIWQDVIPHYYYGGANSYTPNRTWRY